MKQKYYAVKSAQGNKVLLSWDECCQYIKGKTQLKYKAFLTEQEAQDFIRDEIQTIDYKIPTAYIDGSYDVKTGCYSFGGVLLIHNEKYTFSKKYEPDVFSSARNVAGEIKGAGYIIQYCINRGIQDLNIVYDYEGIEKWYNGGWKANSEIAVHYKKFSNEVRNKIKVHFIKVKSHSNNEYNDQADALAKQALGLK